MPMDS
jgi:hypothetical protein